MALSIYATALVKPFFCVTLSPELKTIQQNDVNLKM